MTNKMSTQTIKQGDIVRLTDPISNGEVVRIESVNEYGSASWLGGAQKGDMEQIDMADINSDLLFDYQNLSELVGHIERETGIKLYPESAVEYWEHRAELAEQESALNDKLLKDEHNKLLDVQDKIDKLQSELSRCRAMNADYLTARTEAENRAKLLEKEVADLKVPESRQNRHLRDELHKVRLECQQAWGKANEELVNKATVESELQRVIAERDKYRNFAIELGDKNEALKRQLDESNKQIEIYAKKVRHLEVDLEEGGFNDERNFI